MENIKTPANWQLPLSQSATLGCAASALWTLGSQGIAVRPTPVNAAFAPFAAAVVDADEGRFPLYCNPLHRFAFRTPSVRNVERTASRSRAAVATSPSTQTTSTPSSDRP